MTHGTLVIESWHTYEWVMAHMCMSHSTHINESCQAYEWVMAHIWIRRETCINESWRHETWHTYEWVMAQIWIRHGTHMNTSRDMAHIWIRHDPLSSIRLQCTRGERSSFFKHIYELCHAYEWFISHWAAYFWRLCEDWRRTLVGGHAHEGVMSNI